MIAFLIGMLISVVASVPAVLLAFRARTAAPKQRLKYWVFGLVLRFIVIGAALIALFLTTGLARVPAVAGVAVAYLLAYAVETFIVMHS